MPEVEHSRILARVLSRTLNGKPYFGWKLQQDLGFHRGPLFEFYFQPNKIMLKIISTRKNIFLGFNPEDEISPKRCKRTQMHVSQTRAS